MKLCLGGKNLRKIPCCDAEYNTTTLKQQVLEGKQKLQAKFFKTSKHPPDVYLSKVNTST